MVDIIIPIYNAYEDLTICLESVYQCTNLEVNRLILINDNSPDERIKPYLDDQAKNCQNIIVLHNQINRGFSNNINLGMSQSEKNDVILLNSDTIVTHGWLEKMVRCAYSDRAIGTVTPVSNNATLCSVPFFCEENHLPEGMSVADAGEIVERCSLHKYPRVTVAHGFCMLIKREVIECIGNFDAETFERGYGEENDFCNRAEQAGYHHVMCDDTYIYHSGTKSFVSKEKAAYIKAHERILRDRYPQQMRQNDIHCRDNPNYFVGENVGIYFDLFNGKKNILYVLQSDFREGAADNIGGTQFHVRDLKNGLCQKYNVFVAARDGEFLNLTIYYGEKERRFRFNIGKKKEFFEFYNKELKKIWENVLSAFHIDLVHVHHVISTSLDIFDVAAECKIPVVFTAHDFYSVCPSIRLLNDKNIYCGGTYIEDRCKECLLNALAITDRIDYILLWRKKWFEVLQQCKKIVVPDQSAKEIILQCYPILEDKINVIPHGYDALTDSVYEIASEENNVVYKIEKLEKEGFSYRVSGWGYLKTETQKNNRIYLQVKNSQGKYCILPTSKSERLDVNSGGLSDEVGFSAVLPAAIFDGNELEIRVGILKDRKLHYSIDSYKTVKLSATPQKKLNIAFIGGLSRAKGGEEICSIIKNTKQNVNWYVFGTVGVKTLELLKQDNVIKVGSYFPEDLSTLIKEHEIDAIGILSVWPETYSYTVTEAVLNGVPVIVTDIGALGRRVKELNCGWTISLENLEAEFEMIVEKMIADKNCLLECAQQVGQVKIPSIEEMVAQYQNLYEALYVDNRSYSAPDMVFMYGAYISRRGKETCYNIADQDMLYQIQNMKQELEVITNSVAYKAVRKIWKMPLPGRNILKKILKRL